MLNLIIAGRLGQDAESKMIGDRTVINFSVAHSKSWTDRQTGERKSQTVWLNCHRWTDSTGIVPYLKKGTAVVVEGEPSARAWTDNAGKACASLDLNVRSIELMGKAENSDAAPQTQHRSQAPQQNASSGHPAGFQQMDTPPPFVDNKASTEAYSDDLPF